MVEPTVEYGADMEMDLIIGLIKPKTALLEPTALTEATAPEEAFSAFTELLDGVSADTPTDETAALALPVQISAAMAQDPTPSEPNLTTSTPETEANEASLIAPDQPLEMKVKAETPANVAQHVPAAIKEAQPPTQLPMGGAITVPSAGPDIVKTDQPTKAALATTAPSAGTPPIQAPQQSMEAEAAPMSSQAPNPPTTAMATLAAPLAPPPMARPRSEGERIEPATRIGPAPAPASPAVPLQAQPAARFTNLEAVADDTDALQFGIKIERQTIEFSPTIRHAPQAQPVANQISSQLPQLLSKAEKQTVELRLDPPELGRVTIHLTTHDQQVTAHIVADRADTVDLMRRHAELLTATLSRAGFSQADLSFQQGKGQPGGGSLQQFQSLEPVSDSDSLPPLAPTLSGLDGRLDIRL